MSVISNLKKRERVRCHCSVQAESEEPHVSKPTLRQLTVTFHRKWFNYRLFLSILKLICELWCGHSRTQGFAILHVSVIQQMRLVSLSEAITNPQVLENNTDA